MMVGGIVSYEAKYRPRRLSLPGMSCFRSGRDTYNNEAGKNLRQNTKTKVSGRRPSFPPCDAKGRDLNARIRNWPLFYEICNVVVLKQVGSGGS